MPMYRWVYLVLILVLSSLPVFAKDACKDRELNKGVEAVLRGDIAAAINLFMPLATWGCAEAMYNMGVLTNMMSLQTSTSEGRDLRIDAYMWFTLAAKHHPPGPQRKYSLQNRASSASMTNMTPAQIAEGERLAKAWRAGQKLPAQKPVM